MELWEGHKVFGSLCLRSIPITESNWTMGWTGHLVLEISQPHYSAIAVLSLRVFELNMWESRGSARTQQHALPPTKTDLATAAAGHLSCPSIDTKPSVWCRP